MGTKLEWYAIGASVGVVALTILFWWGLWEFAGLLLGAYK